jgi:SAM-dependent methyltransferase
MYGELASWWPLLSAPADYVEEASRYSALLHEHATGAVESVLELGSGGGNNAFHMKRAFGRLALVDRSPDMLEVSQGLNPDCEHHLGDMRSVRLDRLFDAVFVHDAICYMTTLEDLARVVETAAAHLRPGGVALLAPDYVRETFVPGTEHGGHDEGRRGLRYLSWTWDPEPRDTTYVVDYAFLVREGDGVPRVLHDRHVEGLFAVAEWMDVLEAAGLRGSCLSFEHSEVPTELMLFVGVKG